MYQELNTLPHVQPCLARGNANHRVWLERQSLPNPCFDTMLHHRLSTKPKYTSYVYSIFIIEFSILGLVSLYTIMWQIFPACRDNLQLLRQRYYYATWKADGTRYMMLITMDGCYLIDRNFSFRRVQMRFPCKSGNEVRMRLCLGRFLAFEAFLIAFSLLMIINLM